jgi:hypothetical protein
MRSRIGEAMNFDKMPAGREMDALIHMQVFGVSGEHTMMDTDLGSKIYGDIPYYSSDIAAAIRLFDHLYARGFNVNINADHGWHARRECELTPANDPMRWVNGNADTIPLAICRAALKVPADVLTGLPA